MMFSSDGFLTDNNASSTNTGQTHVFTSFPNSAVDVDDERSENKSTTQQQSDLGAYGLPLPATANESAPEQYRMWQIEYYQKYFQVDTQQVLERLIGSMTPRPNKSYFDSTIRQNPDLYGPFWVCVTFIVTVAISGNIVNYFHQSDAEFQIDFSKITLSAILVCLYWWIMPASVYFFFRWRLNRIEYTFLELLCIYGYSLTIFIPISILWIIPIGWLQWTSTILASIISGSVLIVTFWPTINADHKRFSTVSILAVLFLHLLMAVCIMLVFFHVSDNNINPTTPSTTISTSTILTTAKKMT
ncbi:unnamed protein product [Rotaria magnacalcarata]|uniref:Protein YIPF n=2 Tax=Rotaria magnacalcarata TaxID=392030 RepID=A0A816YGS7_9BILA|nr:unnamed protein product [Rotaria magnacalcarata]CAF2103889.1 unnamed protein product [Rotaria magnacalcarata]CAF2160859.1 unnamed protein product [Rotaria magnacalcarata]CAF3927946.1 unnamed protein product [Rotaria magnacalcarata]CAF4187312.1 unnamed protein product [Rotaria magnacalcarata]